MSAAPGRRTCVCGADEPCSSYCGRHNRALHGYPCDECQREWREANPDKVAQIERLVRLARGKRRA